MPSASLVPAGDQTLLFTNSGMVQFKEVLTGATKVSYTRAVDVQRCLRVAGKHNDFEEIGRSPRHHTFFEMLGNWSFGDYFKREAIHWAWQFLTVDLGIPADRLAATTYKDDDVAWDIWTKRDRPAAGAHGALGRCRGRRRQELLADGRHRSLRTVLGDPLRPRQSSSPRVRTACPTTRSSVRAGAELWNLVFMEFDQRPDGRVPLPFTSVDTGLGLERLATVIQGVASNYDTDLFAPIHAALRTHPGARSGDVRGRALQLPGHRRSLARRDLPGRATTSARPTRVAATSCGASCGARSGTGACSAGRSRSWPSSSAVVVATMGDVYPHISRARRRDRRGHRR